MACAAQRAPQVLPILIGQALSSRRGPSDVSWTSSIEMNGSGHHLHLAFLDDPSRHPGRPLVLPGTVLTMCRSQFIVLLIDWHICSWRVLWGRQRHRCCRHRGWHRHGGSVARQPRHLDEHVHACARGIRRATQPGGSSQPRTAAIAELPVAVALPAPLTRKQQANDEHHEAGEAEVGAALLVDLRRPLLALPRFLHGMTPGAGMGEYSRGRRRMQGCMIAVARVVSC